MKIRANKDKLTITEKIPISKQITEALHATVIDTTKPRRSSINRLLRAGRQVRGGG